MLVSRDSSRCGMEISEPEIVQGMVELIQAGLAKAYWFAPGRRTAEEIPGVPPLEQIGDYYFWATPKGRELQSSDDDWYPFDDNGELRKGWTAPKT
jgi:hypothetical protein